MFEKKIGDISIEVAKKGAELKSFKLLGKEFMWDARPEYWGKTSPVLFPFVGGLKDGKFSYKGKEYESGRHGFARDNEFELADEGENFLKFVFKSNEETLKVYPFEFEFFITYEIKGNTVAVVYEVNNLTDGEMYFSLGAHPAFACDENINYTDFYLEFDKKEDANLYLLDGLYIKDEPVKYLNNENRIQLTEKLFEGDALVFNNLKSDTLTLKNNKNNDFVKVSLTGFPWLGIWAPVGAPFVCIEPWYGVADFVSHNGNIEEKVAINKLEKGENFEATMEITVGN